MNKGLQILVADASERRHWMVECIRQNDCGAVVASTVHDVASELSKGSFDLVLVSQDFSQIGEINRAVKRVPSSLTVIGIDWLPNLPENLGLNKISRNEAEHALAALLKRYARLKRIRHQTTVVASRSAGLMRLNRELRDTNQRLNTVLESARRLFSTTDEDKVLVEILQSIARYTSGAPSVIFVQRKEGLLPKLAMGVAPENLTSTPIAVAPEAWRGAKVFATGLGEFGLEKSIAKILGTDSFFFLPLGSPASATTLLVIGAAPDAVERSAIRNLIPLAALAIRQARRLRDLRGQAQKDSLTGLLNHAAFQRFLRLEVKRHQRMGNSLSVVMLDIDHFKAINDEHGHPAGDRTLKLLAETLRKTSRETDLIARYGGEEFVLILANTSREGAEAKVHEILQQVRKTDWCGVGPLTLSAGIAMYPADGEGPASLIEAADRALYAAKNGGRDRAMTYAEWLEDTLQPDPPPSTESGLNIDHP